MVRCLLLSIFLLLPGTARGVMDAGELRGMLEQLRKNELWGEAILTEGRVRAIRVDSLRSDSVAVCEVVGALHERRSVYALSEFNSLRELGKHRIPLRRALYRGNKSMLSALALEALIPGGGYFYVGETGKGLALVGLTAVAVGTAIASGKDGAAGWVPISVWIKIGSLINLRDQVRAINGFERSARLAVGTIWGGKGAAPALRVQMSF